MKKFKNLFEILEAMNRWQMTLKSPGDLQKLFEKKVGFRATNIKDHNNLHAYPGIGKNNELFFFIIPEEYDIHSPCEDIFNYIQQSPAILLLGGGGVEGPEQIPQTEAEKRTKNWHNHYKCWLESVVSSLDGMYQAFRIPSEKMNSDTYFMHFALSGDASGWKADLVLGINGDLYDTVRSVPPFDAKNSRTRLTDGEEKYHLLSFF